VKPYTFDPEAEAEFLEALARYAEKSQVLGRRYYDAIHALIAEVCHAPTVHRRMPGTREVQRHFRKTFPYAVLYVNEPDHVLILAIAHFKRRPGYWRHRLKR
jgi:toxin ParE1/3/4